MHRHDRFRLLCDRFLDFCLINIHRIRADIHKHTGSAPQNESIRGGYKRIRRHDHFISWLDIRQKCRHLQCMRTGSCQQYVFRLKPVLHPLGTFFCKRTVSADHTVFFYGFFNILCFFSHKRWAVKTNSHSSHSCLLFFFDTGLFRTSASGISHRINQNSCYDQQISDKFSFCDLLVQNQS